MDLETSMRQAAAALRARFAGDDSDLALVADLTTLVAMADGFIDEPESQALATLLEALLGTSLGDSVAMHLVRQSAVRARTNGLDAHARAVARRLAAHGVAEQGVALAVLVAYANGEFSAPERRVVGIVADEAGVPAERLAAIDAAARADAAGGAGPAAR